MNRKLEGFVGFVPNDNTNEGLGFVAARDHPKEFDMGLLAVDDGFGRYGLLLGRREKRDSPREKNHDGKSNDCGQARRCNVSGVHGGLHRKGTFGVLSMVRCSAREKVP